MKLKEHRQRLMATLDAIRKALPADKRAEVEPHLRDILGFDKELREQLRNLPEQLEAARAEVANVRDDARMQAEQAQRELADVKQQLASEQARRNRERGKTLQARMQEWRDVIVEATHASESNAQSLATWLLGVTSQHFTNVARHTPAAAARAEQEWSTLLCQLCTTINAHMKHLEAHFYVHWNKDHFIVQTGKEGDRLLPEVQARRPL